MARPFIVNAADLLRRPGSAREFQRSVEPGELDLDDERLVPEQPVEVMLHLESLIDGIVVRGQIGVSWRGICRRCLEPVADRTMAPVHELYQVVVTDPDAFPVVGDQLDLAGMVREHALLILPDGPLCRVDCAGLCPHCGINRNEAQCECTTEQTDDRWAALDVLRRELDDSPGAEEWLADD